MAAKDGGTQRPEPIEWIAGDWIEEKSPSGVAVRQFLAKVVRSWRADIRAATRTLAERKEDARRIREVYREHRSKAIALEASIAPIRKELDKLFFEICEPEGGVQ